MYTALSKQVRFVYSIECTLFNEILLVVKLFSLLEHFLRVKDEDPESQLIG